MYLSLVKKDFDIVFRGNIGVLFAQMLFILIIISVNMGILGYGLMAMAFGWQLLMSVSAKEKENNSLALLIAMPYEKGKIITTRYISTMIGFAGVTAIYAVLATIVNTLNISILKMLTSEVLLTTMCVYAVFTSITLPLYFKFDDTVVRGVSMFLIVGISMIGSLIWENTDISSRISTMALITDNFEIISIIVAIISLVISRNITLKLFEKMEF